MLEGINSVVGISEHTPARVSGLKYKDQIIACGFVQDSILKVKKGVVNNDHLKNAAAEGKILILVIKRPKNIT